MDGENNLSGGKELDNTHEIFSVESHYNVCLHELCENDLSVGGEWEEKHENILWFYLLQRLPRAPERWERWERVPSQFEILEATFGKPAAIASEISVHQPK